MTINEINEGYQNTEIVMPNFLMFELFTFMTIILIFFFMNRMKFSGAFLVPAVGLTLVLTIIWAFYYIPIEREQRDQFSKIVQEEYMDKLKVQKLDVENYQTIQDTEVLTNHSFFTEEDKHKNILPVEIKGVENGLNFSKKLKADVMKVKGLEKPYLEYQLLTENLPSNKSIVDEKHKIEFKKGYYNPVLYVPEIK